ncbi:segregation and condensation protein A [Pandoraea apista]|uniref:Segregation and condensation protein A n=1 Tax=Pandoraea apista TaxID=93218 RepID=A0A5E5PC00_9BURK|nr:segregation and condensation protein A [Pandoraea apista]
MNPSPPDDPSHTPEPIPEIAPVSAHVDAAPDDGQNGDTNEASAAARESNEGDKSAESAESAASAAPAGSAAGVTRPGTSEAHPIKPHPVAVTTTELPAPQSGQDTTPDIVDGVARARLYGEPLFALPTDLYIPPDALEIFLEAFEGPLDLLLYLIRKQNFNVLDIPMAQVTKQYLLYVEQIRRTNLELASEYLLMAAMLIEIKSRMLLPVKKADTGEEAEDPRAELVRRLLEYEQMKLAAQKLDTLPVLGRDFLRSQVYIEQSLQPRFPDVDAEDLRAAWAEVLRRAKLVQHHKISREELSVREHMSQILRRLQGARFMEFTELFDVTRGVPVVVVNFIAMLELSRESLLEITQAEPFAPIYVRLTYSPN